MKTFDRRVGFGGVMAVALVVGLLVSISMIVSVAAGNTLTKGGIPAEAFRADGSFDESLMPDYVAAYDRDGISIAGYIPNSYFLDVDGDEVSATLPQPDPKPVYAEDLTTLVGHMVPGKGFVPLGVAPDTIPFRAVEQGASE